ncbi:hypothetical protein F4804DRAFT_342806 [Jackrogersella minutella]|nr:hypothetical protein F4804DRAFT_342806 [Jackrogersella minutella]
MSAQDLARSLFAAGSVKPEGNEGEGIYLLSVRDGNLVEKHWVGDTLENENVIASDVRNDTSASYLLGVEPDLRLVVFIDQGNAVQCYAYNEDIEEWEETPLGTKWNITTSPESKLSSTIGPEGEVVISYQDENGHLAGVMSAADDEWEAFGPLDGDPVLGTPQCLEVIDDKLHLFYVEIDGGIGYLVLDSATGNWQVNVLNNTKFDTIVDNFSVAKDTDTGSFQSYFLTGGSLWNVDGEKEKTCLGKVGDNGKLIPSDKAQAGFRIKWRGARKFLAMGVPVEDVDLENLVLSKERYHSTQRNDELSNPESFGIDLDTPPRRWEDWVVKLSFEKLGGEKHGNGFYVNVPNTAFDVIFTAGHNLVDAPRNYCSNIRIINDPFKKNDISVTPDMIRVCEKYFEDPDELNDVHDYGVILLKRGTKERHRGFGFNLILGLAPLRDNSTTTAGDMERDILQDSVVYVSGYMPGDSPSDKPPRRSEGRCVRTFARQLQYKADAMQGMSGGPVWLGFRGVETVVAIHNYGPKKEGQGNRGSRLNLNFWHTIFGWLDVGWPGKSLHYRGSPTYSMHLHMEEPSTSSKKKSKRGWVRVGKPGRVDTLFDVMPVATRPKVREPDAYYGFILRRTHTNTETSGTATASIPLEWVRWDAKKNEVSISKHFDARCEVKIPQLINQSAKPFTIQARCGDGLKQARMEMSRLTDEAELDMLEYNAQNFLDTSEVSFVPITKEKVVNGTFELRQRLPRRG